MSTYQLPILGRSTEIAFLKDAMMNHVPAKVDTGADTSSVWASELDMDDTGTLHFVLFSKKHPLYTGYQHATKSYTIKSIMSSNGHTSVRYSVLLKVRIADKLLTTRFTLSDRSKTKYGVLLGANTLKNNFVVDVSRNELARVNAELTDDLNAQSKADPKAFFDRHYSKQRKN